jgi:transcriptional regulator with XRE-family HTH domain
MLWIKSRLRIEAALLSAGQIKAARALLDWSQDDLAYAAGLSVSTVRNLESGNMSPRSATAHDIRKAIENAGLEFVEPEGIRRRMDEVKIYKGRESADMFFDNMLRTVKGKGGPVIFHFQIDRYASTGVWSCAGSLRTIGAVARSRRRQVSPVRSRRSRCVVKPGSRLTRGLGSISMCRIRQAGRTVRV